MRYFLVLFVLVGCSKQQSRFTAGDPVMVRTGFYKDCSGAVAEQITWSGTIKISNVWCKGLRVGEIDVKIEELGKNYYVQ